MLVRWGLSQGLWLCLGFKPHGSAGDVIAVYWILVNNSWANTPNWALVETD
jgi:hypothetical protein